MAAPPDRKRQNLVRLLTPLCVLVPTLGGVMVGWVGETTAAGALALVAEPLLLALGVYLVLSLLTERLFVPAVGLAAGLALGAFAVRLPPTPQPLADANTMVVARLAGCATGLPSVTRPLRLLHWSMEPAGSDAIHADFLAEPDPDLVLLQGVAGPELGEALARKLDGESLFLKADDGRHTSLVVRGVFQYCGGNKQDRWQMPLPAGEGRSASLSIAFAHVRDAGIVPISAVQLDRPGGIGDWLDWPQRLLGGAQRVAAVTAAIDSRQMLTAGDFAAPRTFRTVAGHMRAAGLHEVRVPASWPTELGPLPALPLHALDRLWVGRDWQAVGARQLSADGIARAAVVVDLTQPQRITP